LLQDNRDLEKGSGKGEVFLLLINNHSLFYWAREARSSNAEIDYIIPCCSSALPIEVNAGKTGTLRSMHIYLDKCRLSAGVRISQLYLIKKTGTSTDFRDTVDMGQSTSIN